MALLNKPSYDTRLGYTANLPEQKSGKASSLTRNSHRQVMNELVRRGCTMILVSANPRITALIPRYVRVNTNLWTCAEAGEYFKSKGLQATDPITNQYGGPLVFGLYQAVTPAEKGSWRMSTYRIFSFSILKLDSTRRRPTNLERSFSRTRHPAFLRSCWRKVLANLMETSSTRRRPPEIRRLTSVLYSGIRERSAPSCSSYVFQLPDRCGVQLFAFERDIKRFATLKSMVKKAGCRNVEPVKADFLKIRYDDRKYANVTHM